eukprot:2333863-Amphidinium_carterae.1
MALAGWCNEVLCLCHCAELCTVVVMKMQIVWRYRAVVLSVLLNRGACVYCGLVHCRLSVAISKAPCTAVSAAHGNHTQSKLGPRSHGEARSREAIDSSSGQLPFFQVVVRQCTLTFSR